MPAGPAARGAALPEGQLIAAGRGSRFSLVMNESLISGRLGHPSALWAFGQLVRRPDVDKRLVYEALCERLGVQADGRRAGMRDALAACARELGVTIPSAAQYEGWRVGSPAGVGAPTTGQLRRACGSWSNALSLLLGAPELDPTRRRLLAHGIRFSQEQVLRAVGAFLASLPRDESPTQSRYLEWAATVPRDADGRTRVPCSGSPWRRTFGSWTAVLRAAGAEPSLIRFRSRPRARRGFTREDAVAALRAAHAELGEPLGTARYDNWGREIERRRACEPDANTAPVPTAHTVGRLFGGWWPALKSALGEGVLLSRRVQPYEYTSEQLMALWQACRQHLGHPPAVHEYDAWRLSRMSHGDGTNSAPHYNTLSRRIGNGSWSGVAAAAGEDGSRPRRRLPPEYTADVLTSAYGGCVTELGHLPSVNEYEQWRESRLLRDPTTRVPADSTLARHLGGGLWAAVAAAVSGNAVNGRIRRGFSYTHDDLVAAWWSCSNDLGRPPGRNAYDGWRDRRLQNDSRSSALPSSVTLLKRLGGGTWRGVGRALDTGDGGGDGAR